MTLEQGDFEAALAEGDRLLIGTPQVVKAYLDGIVEEFRDRPGFYFAPAVQWGDITSDLNA